MGQDNIKLVVKKYILKIWVWLNWHIIRLSGVFCGN